MAAPSRSKFLQYGNADLNGSRDPGAVYNIATGTKPQLMGVCGDPDGGLGAAQARFYTADGKYLFYRPMVDAGAYGDGRLWTYQTVYAPASVNSKRAITATGTATGGTFRVRFNEVDTEPIAWIGSTAATVQAAMERHPDIGKGNVLVTWDAGTRTYTFEFVGIYAHCALSPGFAVINDTYPKTGGMTLKATATANGTSDFPKDQNILYWDIVGYDGSLFSGGTTTRRNAQGPAKALLWTDFPTSFSSTSPTDEGTVTTPRPKISWVYTPGTILGVPVERHRVLIYELVAGVPEEDPTLIVDKIGDNLNAYTEFTLTAAQQLDNTKEYRRFHEVWKKSGAKFAADYDFTVNYARPAQPSAVTWSIGPGNSYIGMNWTATSMSDSTFISYVVKVRPASAAETSEENVTIWEVTNKAQNFGYLFRLPKNIPIIVSFYIKQYQFGDEVLSQPREFSTQLDIHSAMLANPYTREYAALDAHLGLNVDYQDEPHLQRSWGRKAPTAVFGGPQSRTAQLTVKLMGTPAEQQAQYKKIESLYLNKHRRSLVYSDTTGEWFECVLGPPSKFIPGAGAAMQVTVPIREVYNATLV